MAAEVDASVLAEFAALVVEEFLQRKQLTATQRQLREERGPSSSCDRSAVWYKLVHLLKLQSNGSGVLGQFGCRRIVRD